MNDNVINDNFKIISDIFKNIQSNDSNQRDELLIFVSTEKWVSQLGRRINR